MMETTFKFDVYRAPWQVGAQTVLDADERREEPRIYGPFPARARGRDARGARFETDTVLENLSSGDFCVRLSERMEAGERLFVVTRINKAIVVLRGRVSHTLARGDDSYAVAARIMRYRFLHQRNSD